MADFSGAKFIHGATSANKPHIFGFTTARTSANDPIFELWNGATVAARVFWVDKDGDLTLSAGLTLGGPLRWGIATVALGGGAAPTLGTIGGSGPATSAQNGWFNVLDSAGATRWIPVWA